MQNIDWASLGFKYMDTHCHIRHVWRDGAWDAGELVTEPYLKMHIAASCLHYGQEAFEGLKAFRCKDGKVRIFRPHANAERMFNTARRTCMAQVPVELFVDAVKRVVKANEDFVPPYGTGGSMYIRRSAVRCRSAAGGYTSSRPCRTAAQNPHWPSPRA